ncbi:hypothetical protein CS078_25080 [Pseudomonas prosekii]|uniref:Uncharacterized protein n=1 Tax=Pseudomonas prosekii TaxID=1148509 RepID=A0A3L8CUL3_9PSED|nr:hypothetical protein CS078_25080 [Pseudomonas prosekii]RLU11650.1 hypothetical protein CS076_10660 [Pseudomonas prosekii]
MNARFVSGAKPVGAELAREAVGQAMQMLTDPPPSRAGSLLQGFAVNARFVSGAKPVGAELAREAVGQVMQM